MAENNNINVPGYAQKVEYGNNIEYRNFSPDLVGNLPFDGDNNNTSLFTYGNFVLTTNTSTKQNLYYPATAFSKFYTLNDLTTTTTQPTTNGAPLYVADKNTLTSVVDNNTKIVLNLDNSKLDGFAYFGSATEFIRVTLESIISKWPASLFLNPVNYINGSVEPTILNYTYNSYLNTTKIFLNTNTIYNQFDIVYINTGYLLTENLNPLRNFSVNYKSFNFSYNGAEYPIIENISPTNERDGYLLITVAGNPFNNMLLVEGNNAFAKIHLKPNNIEIEKYFKSLEPFEANLLNRLTTPKFTSTFNYSILGENGIIYQTSKSITWPTSDGYNIDFDTGDYILYVTNLIDICNENDSIKTDLIFRFLTSESISNFDTVPRCDGTEEETAGQKMTKTLRIYGREFDEIKKYIDGISYAHSVSYDKKRNTPDQVLKYLTRTLGWELTNSIVQNDIISGYLDTPPSTYSGQTVGLTAVEAEIELWRRLFLNSAWLFKSKGTRKAVEFLFKFIGAPEGLINLNEYLYVAKEKIDINYFIDTLTAYGLPTNLALYPIDINGYPKFLPDTPSMYFQKGGQWYKETGGEESTNFTNVGNNPHIGPYDGGFAYINQLRNLIPNFEPKSITSTTYSFVTNELFTNYNNGIINNYTGDTYVDVETFSGVSLADCFLYESKIIKDPKPTAEETPCGCDLPTDDLSLYINVVRDEYTFNEQSLKCDDKISGYTFINQSQTDEYYDKPEIYMWDYYTYNPNGTQTNTPYNTPFISKVCCKTLVNGESYLHDDYQINDITNKPILINSGYICCNKNTKCACYLSCKWRLAGKLLGEMYSFNNNTYLKFVTPKNNWGENGTPEYRVVNENGSCMCPTEFTIPELITDPYTQKQGYACKINKLGSMALSFNPNNSTYGTKNSKLYQLFYQKSNGDISCVSQTPEDVCKITMGNIKPMVLLPNGNFDDIDKPQITLGTQPYTYKWIISQKSGGFTGYNISGSDTSVSVKIVKTSNTPLSEIFGTITVKLIVTDYNGCSVSKTVTYVKNA